MQNMMNIANSSGNMIPQGMPVAQSSTNVRQRKVNRIQPSDLTQEYSQFDNYIEQIAMNLSI